MGSRPWRVRNSDMLATVKARELMAGAMLVTLAVFAPAALLVPVVGGGLTALWWAIAGVMMGARLVTLWLRARSGRWVVTGAVRA